MRRFGSALLMLVLLGAAPPPVVAADVPGPVPGDRLSELAGTWSCRTAAGGTARVVVEQPAADTVILRDERFYPNNTLVERETFRRDVATGGWRVEPEGAGFRGNGPAWTGDAWVLEGAYLLPGYAEPQRRQLHLERPDADTLRIYSTRGKPDETTGGELCRRGGTAPDASMCVVPNAPAYVIRAAEPETPYLSGGGGLVRVMVALDAQSRVTDAKIQQSQNSALNAASLNAARASTYQTALRDCKPVPSSYLFSVDYAG